MVELDGQRVRLREFRRTDLDAIAVVLADDRVTAWMAFDSLTRDQQAGWLAGVVDRAAAAPRAEWYLAVTPLDRDSPHDDTLVGFVRVALSGVRAAKLGYAVGADHWGHGYATDAARTAVGFAFGPLGLHRVTAAVGPDNAASHAVVERLGFRREGRLRDHVFTNGRWRDSELYSLLAPEWPAPE